MFRITHVPNTYIKGVYEHSNTFATPDGDKREKCHEFVSREVNDRSST